MAKIDIGQKDGYAPKVKVDQLVAGQEYPFQATFKHAHRKAVVIPSAKHDGVIPPKTDTTFTLNSYEQAWEVVMDIAGLAEIWRRDDFASLASKAPAASVPAPAPATVAVAASEVKV